MQLTESRIHRMAKYLEELRESIWWNKAYSKQEQTIPSGTWTMVILLLRSARSTVKLIQVLETTGILVHPSGGLILPVQAVIAGDAS